MNMLKKMLSLTLFFLFSFSVVPSFTRLSAIEDFGVEVHPRRIDTRASYILSFKLEKALEVRDWVKIQFPKGTRLPEISSDPEKRRQELTRIIESIYIGSSPCSSCQGLPEVNYLDNSIRFNVHMGLDPSIKGYETIRITMTERIGIINPSNPGWYQISISTAKEPSPKRSEPYEIVTSRIGDPDGQPEVLVDPSTGGSKASYSIAFKVGRGGALRLNQSRIRIEFPAETKFEFAPEAIHSYWVQVNGRPVSVRLMLYENILTFITPINVNNESWVLVEIAKEVGIINPSKPGAYTIQVSSSEDPQWVESKRYMIEKNEPTLLIVPDIVSRIAEYQLGFFLEPYETLSDTYPLEIFFPENVFLPQTINPLHVEINQVPVSRVSTIGNQLIIFPSNKIPSGNFVAVTFKEQANIQNPSEPGLVRLGFMCHGSLSTRITSSVQIQTIDLKWLSVHISPPNAGSLASYHFSFQLGSSGFLRQGDLIEVFFPEGAYIQAHRDTSKTITVNEISIIDFHWIEEDSANKLQIQLSIELPSESIVNLIVPREIGIHNPKKENQWVEFFLSTTAENNPVVSARTFIPPSLPETRLSFLEGTQGNKDWFIDPPTISLESNQEEVNIFYWWDDRNDNLLHYDGPVLLDPGFYITQLNFYSESAYGKEIPQSVLLKVDTILPYFVIDHPPSSRLVTNQKTLSITGRVTPSILQNIHDTVLVIDQPLLINGNLAHVSEDGRFSFIFELSEKENTILISCFDEAGHKTDKNLHVILDTKPPKLEIFSPQHHSTVKTRSVLVQGKTDPGSQMLVQDVFAQVLSDGSFEQSISFVDSGQQEIYLKATDSAGNISEKVLILWAGITIRLTIGSEIVYVNEAPKYLDIEPFIHNGRTMVPVRLLAEEFGATLSIEFDPISKRVIKVIYVLNDLNIELWIGQSEALVNGKKIKLDAPATIIRQRTLIPLRFVAESLNAQVTWKTETESIEIVYWDI